LLADRDTSWQNRVIKGGNAHFIRLSAGLPVLMRFPKLTRLGRRVTRETLPRLARPERPLSHE
jgi:hypothetical protein